MSQSKSTNEKHPDNAVPVGGDPITPSVGTALTGIGVLTAIVAPILAICIGIIRP
ncbi:MAG: hypothetical protein KME17_07600 [Cyanosarcina radialis HA8281-LM2]|jgi:hypothetical protein|nr:hypothetical protein [Cyanosarcina radialis HA8281-LM2]